MPKVIYDKTKTVKTLHKFSSLFIMKSLLNVNLDFEEFGMKQGKSRPKKTCLSLLNNKRTV